MTKTPLITSESDAYRLSSVIEDALDNVKMIQARRNALLGKGYCAVFEDIREGYPIIGEICERLEGVADLISYAPSGNTVCADFDTFVDIANLINLTDNISSTLAIFERT